MQTSHQPFIVTGPCRPSSTQIGESKNCDASQSPISGSSSGIASLDDCMDLCLNTQGCAYFAYYPRTKWCNLNTLCDESNLQSSAEAGTLHRLERCPTAGASAVAGILSGPLLRAQQNARISGGVCRGPGRDGRHVPMGGICRDKGAA